MFSDKLVDLVESGAVTGMNKSIDRGKIVSSFLAGSRKLYDFVNENPEILMLDVEYVNVCFPFTLMCDVERWIDSQLFFFCRIPQRLLSTDKFAPSTVALRLISLVKSALIRLGLSFQSHHHIITSSHHHFITSSHHPIITKRVKWMVLTQNGILSADHASTLVLEVRSISSGPPQSLKVESPSWSSILAPHGLTTLLLFLPSRSFLLVPFLTPKTIDSIAVERVKSFRSSDSALELLLQGHTSTLSSQSMESPICLARTSVSVPSS